MMNPIQYGSKTVTLIVPRNKWSFVNLKEIIKYRELLWVLALRDIKVQYKQTFLGMGWALLQPLLTMIVFSVIFGRFAKIPSEGNPYPIFIYAALLPWTFFANSISKSGASIVSSASLISKVYFPRIIIPLASMGVGFLDMIIAMGLMVLMMFYYGVGITWNLCLLPVMFMVLILLSWSIGTLLSALTVCYRDFRFVIPFMVQIWMFVTPVVYPASMVPEPWRWVLFLNPMAGVIEGFRNVFFGGRFDWNVIGISFLTGSLIFVIGIRYFEKVERKFADII